jgi:6,7-dimethyl-8-ribityllumazine synthase
MLMKRKHLNKKIKIALVVSRFNKAITDGLLTGAIDALKKSGVSEQDIKIVYCPGAFEIPLAAQKLCLSKKFNAIVCLGAVIKGETAHFEYIAYAVTRGIVDLNIKFGIPVIFGVLTCYTEEQALRRSSPDADNKGAEAASAALEMVKLLHSN